MYASVGPDDIRKRLIPSNFQHHKQHITQNDRVLVALPVETDIIYLTNIILTMPDFIGQWQSSKNDDVLKNVIAPNSNETFTMCRYLNWCLSSTFNLLTAFCYYGSWSSLGAFIVRYENTNEDRYDAVGNNTTLKISRYRVICSDFDSQNLSCLTLRASYELIQFFTENWPQNIDSALYWVWILANETQLGARFV